MLLTLGEKIKRARTEQGITQSQLCGDFITRNMLSKIENGNAVPSLPTIEYIAGELDIPIGYFLSDSGEFAYRKEKLLPRIKNEFRARNYRECIRLCESLPDGDDEINYILSYSYCRLAAEHYRAGSFSEAKSMFECAAAYSEKTIYDSGRLKQTSEAYIELMSGADITVHDRDIEAMIYISVISAVPEKIDAAGENAVNGICDILVKDKVYNKHLNARLEMAKGGYSAAKELLLSAIADGGGYSVQVRCMLYADLEECCTHTGDFETAYNCTKLRFELKAAMDG